jgi:hypothetical protein
MLKDFHSNLSTLLAFVGFGVLAAGSKQSFACYRLHFGFLFGLFFDPEDGGGIFFRNIS